MSTDSKWQSYMSRNTREQNNTPKNYRMVETSGHGFNAATTSVIKQPLRQGAQKTAK